MTKIKTGKLKDLRVNSENSSEITLVFETSADFSKSIMAIDSEF